MAITSIRGAAKAWVNFNGTGTVAIRDSLNVSSITDNAVGDYTINYTTSFSSINYCAVGSAGEGDTNFNRLVTTDYTSSRTVSAIRILVSVAQLAAAEDPLFACVACFGDF